MKILFSCYTIAEAISATGMSHKQLYNFLKKHHVKMQYPHTWLDQYRELYQNFEKEVPFWEK